MTKTVLLISFIILLGRLLNAAVVAMPHYQEKQLAPDPNVTEISKEAQGSPPVASPPPIS